MAKQLVNPFERHVEKLVLGIAGLLLIGVLLKFVFSSPNKITLGGQLTTPGTIDVRLAQKANDILQRIRDAKPNVTPHDPKFDEFVAILSPVKITELPAVASIGPEMPVVDAREVTTGGAKLVEIPAPPKPKFTQGRNILLSSSPQGGADIRTPVDWVTLAIPFDVKAQSDRQRQAWGATMADGIFATPEVQRRAMKNDGSWSDGDWQTITLSPAFKMPPPPTIRLSEVGGKVVANRDDQRAAEKYQEEIREPKDQLQILRPLPPNFTKDGSPWKFPIISSYETVVIMDQEFLTPLNPTAQIEDRYGGAPTDSGKPKQETKLSPAQLLAQKLEEAKAQMESGRKLWSPNEVTLAYNKAVEITGDKDATADLKTKAQKLMKEIDLLLVDIRRSPGGPPGPVGPGPKVPGTPEPKAREKMPQQEIWAFDAAAGSVVNGQTYQYRMRPRVLNRLAGLPEAFANPTDAQVIFVAGEWSEPTDPIHIPEASWFFVTRDEKTRKEVYAEFFRWYDGVWVKTKSAVNFHEGQPLAHQERVPVPSQTDPTVAETPMVDFGEDLALLDIEFAMPVRERKSSTGSAAVKFAAQPTPETAAVFVNGKGELKERVVAVDKENTMKKKIASEVWTPKKVTP